MTNKLESKVNDIVHNRIEVELAKLLKEGVKYQLMDILRTGYEGWSTLLAHAKSAGLSSGSEYLAKVISEEFGIKCSSESVRSGLSAVRKERAERVFKKNGKPFKNSLWDKS